MRIKKIKVIAIGLMFAISLNSFSISSVTGELEYVIGDHEFEVIEMIEPTCTEDGRVVRRCIYCSDVYVEYLFAIGCLWGSWITEVEATCTSAGRMRRNCYAGFPHSETREILPTGHQYEEVIREPTCDRAGERTTTCLRCDYSRTEPFGEALPHQFVERIIQEPSCHSSGERVFACENCERTYIESIPILFHDWGEWIIEHYPEEGIEGSRYRSCVFCGEREIEWIPALEILPVLMPEAPAPPPFIGVEEALVLGGNFILWVILSIFLFSEFAFLLWQHRKKKEIRLKRKLEEKGIKGYEYI